jgi:hypothetical protein
MRGGATAPPLRVRTKSDAERTRFSVGDDRGLGLGAELAEQFGLGCDDRVDELAHSSPPVRRLGLLDRGPVVFCRAIAETLPMKGVTMKWGSRLAGLLVPGGGPAPVMELVLVAETVAAPLPWNRLAYLAEKGCRSLLTSPSRVRISGASSL